jgi:hypothetical protein
LKIIYKTLNLRNIEFEIHHLKVLQSENYLLFGIEVTYPEIQNFLHFNVDPQHDLIPQRITTIEKIFELKDQIIPLFQKFEKICFITIKPDADSIGSFALLDIFINQDIYNDHDLIVNINRIGAYDQHGRDNWMENVKPVFTLPPALLTMIADSNLNISEKVKYSKQFLLTSKFTTYNYYSEVAFKKQQVSKDKIILDIITPKKLIYVESSYRGAVSKGYKYCPIVIAKNPNYIFGLNNNKVKGPKFTIAQYNSEYINLKNILNSILQIELGWGGSDSIIGSSQSNPSKLSKNDLVEIVKQYVE